ncbi:hypothetical protein A9K75_08590 [Campylobacter fetus subsp. testudinum]|uniref:hypothetical protein n=1 Tax=Campylobacter fetus TaxID=196 RepID=UPI000818A70C|nr:hypothetical protein [Campylobacter fetus]OCR99059.1 hypothetical protein A9K75_08590 [Campylobacter fetus subsp. testudinum]
MGRYYSGDINGKFSFAVQDSDAASYFGVEGYMPNILCYSFDGIDYTADENEIGDFKAIRLFELCEEANKFLSSMLIVLPKELKDLRPTLQEQDIENLIFDAEKSLYFDKDNRELRILADIVLGYQILSCLEDNNYCEFEAEL